MIAIKNDGFLFICNTCDCSGFVPGIQFEYDANAGTITVTEGSTFSAGDDLKIVHINVTDKHGNNVYGKIEAAADDVAIDVSDMNADGGFNVMITIVTNDHCTADLTVYGIAANTPASGTIGTFVEPAP